MERLGLWSGESVDALDCCMVRVYFTLSDGKFAFDQAIEFLDVQDEAFAVFFWPDTAKQEHEQVIGEAFDGAAPVAFVEDRFVI